MIATLTLSPVLLPFVPFVLPWLLVMRAVLPKPFLRAGVLRVDPLVAGEQLPQLQLEPADAVHVERAPHLATLPALPHRASPAEHREMPGDPGLAHPQLHGQLVDRHLSGAGQQL